MDSDDNTFYKKPFFSHVFSTNDESKAEVFNTIQYALFAIIPIFLLNKLIQQYLPDPDVDKSTLELTFEVFLQLTAIFLGIILIHRLITYFPTYSGVKYDGLVLTHVILAFLIIVLSLQTKIGIKTNMIYERFLDVWNGTTYVASPKKKAKSENDSSNAPGLGLHVPSQADYLDDSRVQSGMFPPAPVPSTRGLPAVSAPSYNEPLPSNFNGNIFSSY